MKVCTLLPNSPCFQYPQAPHNHFSILCSYEFDLFLSIPHITDTMQYLSMTLGQCPQDSFMLSQMTGFSFQFNSVQLLSPVWLFVTPGTSACQASLSIINSWNLFKLNRIYWVGDAIQPSHPLLSPSFPTFNISQHQGLFQWVSYLHLVAKVLEFQPRHQSFQWIFKTDFI